MLTGGVSQKLEGNARDRKARRPTDDGGSETEFEVDDRQLSTRRGKAEDGVRGRESACSERAGARRNAARRRGPEAIRETGESDHAWLSGRPWFPQTHEEMETQA